MQCEGGHSGRAGAWAGASPPQRLAGSRMTGPTSTGPGGRRPGPLRRWDAAAAAAAGGGERGLASGSGDPYPAHFRPFLPPPALSAAFTPFPWQSLPPPSLAALPRPSEADGAAVGHALPTPAPAGGENLKTVHPPPPLRRVVRVDAPPSSMPFGSRRGERRWGMQPPPPPPRLPPPPSGGENPKQPPSLPPRRWCAWTAPRGTTRAGAATPRGPPTPPRPSPRTTPSCPPSSASAATPAGPRPPRPTSAGAAPLFPHPPPPPLRSISLHQRRVQRSPYHSAPALLFQRHRGGSVALHWAAFVPFSVSVFLSLSLSLSLCLCLSVSLSLSLSLPPSLSVSLSFFLSFSILLCSYVVVSRAHAPLTAYLPRAAHRPLTYSRIPPPPDPHTEISSGPSPADSDARAGRLRSWYRC